LKVARESSTPLGAVHGLAIALTRVRPERSESRDDDLLGKNVGINTIFWALKAFNDLNDWNGWNVLNRLASQR
jgi:hypothetical protein